jgi:glutaconate CoA-transferase, subunit A
MIWPSGVSLAAGMWSRAYSHGSRTSTTFSSPVLIRSLAASGESRPNGSPGCVIVVWKDTAYDPLVKLMALAEAVDRLVPDEASIVMGTALESLIPFAAGHAIIRQHRKELELIGPISDMLFDQLIGAGCARRITAAWVGNVSAGLGHNYRRAVESGIPRALELEEHSNFSVGLGLLATAMGVPYLPTRTLLGSDLLTNNPRLMKREPGLVHVQAIEPDVAILHVQRADAEGHAHCWGNLGITREAGLAARRVILTAEEIVPTEVILSDPNRILLPPYRVSAVVHAPGGAYPSPVQGYYGRDHAAFTDYHTQTRTREGFLKWLNEWVFSGTDANVADRVQQLRPTEKRLAAAVDYA